jgi:hypothetical protein
MGTVLLLLLFLRARREPTVHQRVLYYIGPDCTFMAHEDRRLYNDPDLCYGPRVFTSRAIIFLRSAGGSTFLQRHYFLQTATT